MAQRKIEWSPEAKNSFESILEFYIKRNGNKTYSKNLFKQIKQTISLIQKNNFIGKATDEGETRVLFKYHYSVFYEVKEKVIEIQLIWDNRRNPDKLKI
jgi:plasmid stabilization system protein ParE